MGGESGLSSVMVTGATGFVGRSVVRRLLARGLKPICVVRSPRKLYAQHPDVPAERLTAIAGSLHHRDALQQAADLSQAAIHLVGIIIERRLQGQTFRRVHVRGTQNVVTAVERAGITRLVHMSALGTREDATSAYHRSKWQAENAVRNSELQAVIVRPSLIHGPRGEFMRLMKRFVCGFVPPVIPYFGAGTAKLQPVFVEDVARCIVEAVDSHDSVGKVVLLAGPKAYTWIELYKVCRSLIPGARLRKPIVSQPVPIAKAMALLMAPLMAPAELLVPSIGLFRFDRGQVDMSQEDSTCDHTLAERLFGVKMRSFEEELAAYGDQID